MKKYIDEAVVILLALLCIIISLGEFLGFLDNITWISNRIPTYILLILSTFVIYHIIHQHQVEGFNEQSYTKILEQVESLSMNNEYGNNIGELFKIRERDIYYILAILEKAKNNSELIKQTENLTQDLFDGKIGERKLGFSWDLTVTVIDDIGTFIFHPNNELINTRVSPNIDIYQQIIKNKAGVLNWKNRYQTEKMLSLSDKCEVKSSRLSKVYFRENIAKTAIIVIESHINIIDRFKV